MRVIGGGFEGGGSQVLFDVVSKVRQFTCTIFCRCSELRQATVE
jgi:hypothetical protein